MNTNTRTIKYVIYARKSSEEDGRQILSLDSQENVLKEIAKRDSLIVTDTLREARSAKEPNKRPIFAEMIKTIERGRADGILCWKIDRLARNPVEEGMIKWLLQTGKIQKIKTPDRDYQPEDNALIASVEFGMANQYIRDLSANVKRGLYEKAKRGIFPTLAPIGYLNNPLDPKGNKEIVKDAERFHLVRKIFDLILEGHYTPVEAWRIARKNWKLTVPNGKLVGRSTIYRLLTNSFYYGAFEYPLGSGEWHKGRHEPMITAEEYDKIQIILGRKGKPRPKSHVFCFTGLMKCGTCGAAITAEEKVKLQKNGNVHRYIYYHCTKRIDPSCPEGCIEEKELVKQIADKLSRISIPPEFHAWAMKWLRNDIRKDAAFNSKVVDERRVQLDSIERNLKALLDLLLKGTITDDEYKNKKTEISKEKARIELLPAGGNNRIQRLMEKAAEYFDLGRDAASEFASDDIDKRRRVITKLGSNPLLKDKTFMITIEKPLLVLESISKEINDIRGRLEPVKNGINKKEIERAYAQNPILRRGRDSNPRTPCEVNILAGCSFQPLRHLSKNHINN